MTAARDAEMIQDDESVSDDSKILLGRYRLKEQIGKGGMGIVFRAEDVVLQREVVVKKLDWQGSTEAIRRFHLEAKAAGKLKHENTVSVHDFGTTPDGELYLVMEFINGKALDQIIRESGNLPPEMVIDLFLLILRGLDHAHSNGIVHRDIKPSNIMMMESEDSITPKLMDFGISRIKDEDQSITQNGAVVGSPQYASPEQARGSKVDERSDIYSVGCTMFECLTGAPPFDSELAVTTSMMHINQTAPTLKEKGLHLPSDLLEQVVAKCLAKDPDSRFQSARELSDALKGVRAVDYVFEDATEGSRSISESSRVVKVERLALSGKSSKTLTLRLLIIAAIGCFGAFVYFLVVRIMEKSPAQYVVALTDDPYGHLSDFGDQRDESYFVNTPQDLRNLDEDVAYLHLNNDSVITEDCLRGLFRYKLNTIFLSNTSIGSEGLKTISRMDLEGLSLAHAKNVSDKDMLTLAKSRLSMLDLSGTTIGTTGLEYLSTMGGLQSLKLADCPGAVDAGVEAISNMPCLTKLDLRNTRITDKSLDCLTRGLVGSRLEILFLGDCKGLTASGLQKALSSMKRLKLIDVSSTNFDDRAMTAIVPLKSLSRLDLGNTAVTDVGIEMLTQSECPISVLSISHLHLSRKVLARLSKLHSLKVLDASGLGCGDDGLLYFARLELKGINLCQNNVSVTALVNVLSSMVRQKLYYVALDQALVEPVHRELARYHVDLTIFLNNYDRRSVVEVPIRTDDNLKKEFRPR